MATEARPAPDAPAVESARWSRLLYVHVIVVSLAASVVVALWFILFEQVNKLIWDGGFVTDHAWMFPVICLPLSLAVGLLVKYAKAPSNLDGSMLDSLTGDVDDIRWQLLPATVATSLASLWSGAVLGPEGAIGNLSSRIAAGYCRLFRIPEQERPKLIFGSVAAGYNGLLQNPVFTAVLGTEAAQSRQSGLELLPANLIGGGVGYAVFLALHNTGFVDFLHLPPVTSFRLVDALAMVPLALLGLVLAVLTALFMKAAEAFFGRLKQRVVLRALVAGAIFSVVGVFAPVMMFSGETQVQTVIQNAAGYGIALLLVMAVAKLALLSVGFKSGFLGGPTFPLIFASTSVALALNLAIPSMSVTVLLAGVMTGAVYMLFRMPLMVVLLTGFMLAANSTLTALIVLALATVMIAAPPLQRRMQARQAARAAAKGPAAGAEAGRPARDASRGEDPAAGERR
jgi:H+/Cl- antiporter ClcA